MTDDIPAALKRNENNVAPFMLAERERIGHLPLQAPYVPMYVNPEEKREPFPWELK